MNKLLWDNVEEYLIPGIIASHVVFYKNGKVIKSFIVDGIFFYKK